jgi:glycosyltransferase involved in cell wall biosynthesis
VRFRHDSSAKSAVWKDDRLTQQQEIWPDGPPRDAWHSFDATPWLHPWLTRANLRAMREASAGWRAEARRVVERADRVPNNFGFVGNMANVMAMPARYLVRKGVGIEVFRLYGDQSIFSDARWEEYDGVLGEGISYTRVDSSFLDGVQTSFPFSSFDATGEWATMRASDVPSYARDLDFRRWPQYFCNLQAFDRLQAFDALFAAQGPYVAYLSGRPYAATTTGGDIWLECSRDDALGRLQRTAFAQAGCVLVTTPWLFAHARRYGFNNFLYLPFIIDEQVYAPGPPELRAQWHATSGGDFFVLSTARADDYYKGPQIGLRGFAEFSRKFAGARLVVTVWGNNIEAVKKTSTELGISDRVLFMPVAGKRRLIKYLRSADCLLDQFVVGYYGATALEAAACGVPVIMRLEQAQYEALFEGGAPPFVNAVNSTEVANALEFVALDPERRHKLSADHRDWFLRNHGGDRWGADYVAVLGALALGHRFSFIESPLAADLSPTEILYHSEQLASAPTFPNYERTPSLEEHLKRIEDRLSLLATRVAQQSDLALRIENVEQRSAETGRLMSRLIDPIMRVRRLLGIRR